jgi:hypothetical protein
MSEIKKSNSSIDQETIKSEEEKTIHQSSADGEDQGYYPVLLESAPFPALGSVDEISQTISRIKSNATQRSYNDSTKNEKYELEEEEKVRGGFQQEAYHTEGLRNPGWLTVISCFLVNFFVFGTTFTWGNYQKL